jgi:putative flavoprotein involved in K+ transport
MIARTIRRTNKPGRHHSTHRDVIVVGGGQAGLAIGYHLAKQDRSFTILDAAPTPAAAWRGRWDSLELFTPVRYDSLPGRPFPGDPDTYPGRDDVVDYLTAYAREFELPVELDSRVRSVSRSGEGYLVELDGRSYEADQVVIATGPFQVPRTPHAMAAQLHSDVVHFHSGDYRSPAALPPGPVLVVGGGNTGFQIAAELSATHEVHLSIGTRQMPLPQRIFGRDLFRFLEATGLMRATVDSRIGRRAQANETLVGSGPRSLRRKHGVAIRPRTTGAAGTAVSFEDGTAIEVSSVIWATGFGLDHSIVDVPVLDADGRPIHRRGVTESPGLYFLGLPWLLTRGSALLGWVGQDAEYLANRIAQTRPAGASTARTEAFDRTGEPV